MTDSRCLINIWFYFFFFLHDSDDKQTDLNEQASWGSGAAYQSGWGGSEPLLLRGCFPKTHLASRLLTLEIFSYVHSIFPDGILSRFLKLFVSAEEACPMSKRCLGQHPGTRDKSRSHVHCSLPHSGGDRCPHSGWQAGGLGASNCECFQARLFIFGGPGAAGSGLAPMAGCRGP